MPESTAVQVTLAWGTGVLTSRRVCAGALSLRDLAPMPVPRPLEAQGLDTIVARVTSTGKALACVPEGVVASLWSDDGRMDLVCGPADVEVFPGQAVELVFGRFRLWITDAIPLPFRPPAARSKTFAAALAFAAAAHFGALAFAAIDARPLAGQDVGLEGASHALYLHALAAASERRQDPQGDDAPAGGTRAQGVAAAADTRIERRRHTVPAIDKHPPPSLSRAEALAGVSIFGMIGLLGASPPASRTAFAADVAPPVEDTLWASRPGDAVGVGGLVVLATAGSAAGFGEGIRLGDQGVLGHAPRDPGPASGGGASRLCARAVRAPWASGGEGVSSGRLPPETIQRIVRLNYGHLRLCYQRGLVSHRDLEGRVAVRFVIVKNGSVASAVDAGSTLADASVVACVVRAFQGISFPALPTPEAGAVTVTYPVVFTRD